MNKFSATALIPTIAAFRGDVLASRSESSRDFARGLHDALVAKLDSATDALHEAAETEKRLAAGKGTEDGDFLYEIYHTCTTFENRWVESGPISILDEIHEDVVFEGESCRIGLEYTIVPDAELEGLAEILDSIRRETGIEFVGARV